MTKHTDTHTIHHTHNNGHGQYLAGWPPIKGWPSARSCTRVWHNARQMSNESVNKNTRNKFKIKLKDVYLCKPGPNERKYTLCDSLWPKYCNGQLICQVSIYFKQFIETDMQRQNATYFGRSVKRLLSTHACSLPRRCSSASFTRGSMRCI